MLYVAYFTFVLLLLLALHFGFKSWKSKQKVVPTINNPAFIAFQTKYFRVYFLALLAEWLQGPYLYQLYHDYGFVDPYIGIIYVCGFVSSIFFGTYTGLIADYVGRKKICVLFTILYSLCCLTKMSSNFALLCLGRILGGVSTSLLFSSFDAWYMYEHTENFQFPSEWLDATFSKATFWNSVIAISAGFLANFVSEWLKFGPAAPFLIAIPFLIVAGVLIQTTWTENYGKSSKPCRSCLDGLKAILSDRSVFLIGAVQAMFESVMYIFVFLWTPVLQPAQPPLGIVFACFMCSIWLGSSIFEYLFQQKIFLTTIISIVMYSVMFTNALAAIASISHPRMSFFLFILTEILCGIYFPAMGRLRSKVLPAAMHSTIMNWFRVPLNVIASIVLLVLHDSHSNHGIRHMFMLCSCLLLCGGLFSVLLHMNVKNKLQSSEEVEEENGIQT